MTKADLVKADLATELYMELEHQLCELIKSRSAIRHKKIAAALQRRRDNATNDAPNKSHRPNGTQ